MVEVQLANIVDPDDITDEIELWEYLKIYTSDANPCTDFSSSTSCSGTDYFKIGLFGNDMTDFFADCEVAYKKCNSTNYREFDGWAIGMQGGVSASTTYYQGFCTNLDSNCVFLQV